MGFERYKYYKRMQNFLGNILLFYFIFIFYIFGGVCSKNNHQISLVRVGYDYDYSQVLTQRNMFRSR